MELGICNLRSAISWYLEYTSNGDYYIPEDDIDRHIINKTFPHIEYFYDQRDIDLDKINSSPKIIKLKANGDAIITSIPNNILVHTNITKKKAEQYSHLANKLRQKNITLEEVVDIEFFELYEAHELYKLELNGEIDNLYNEFSNETTSSINKNNFIKKTSMRDIAKLLYRMKLEEFESTFMGEDPSHLYDILDNTGKQVNKEKFTAFLDTEKIHIQLAICSHDKRKKIPVLAYFGYGNYYPFAQGIKNKDLRFGRFSQINSSDQIDHNYYIKEINKSKEIKERELKEKINFCQKKYHAFFMKNFSLEIIREKYHKSNESENKYPQFIDKLISLEPIIRTKSAALIAYNYKFYS